MAKFKLPLIVFGVLALLALMIFGIFISTQNKAINLEEQIKTADADIEVQEKRRTDLVYNLVDTVKAYAVHEQETLVKLTEARAKASGGDVENAQLAVTAVAENYPALQANENYKQLMTELAITENLIAEHRNNYNKQIRSYNKFVRRWPARAILEVMGYEKIEDDYKEYNAPSDAPQDLFGE